MTESPNSTPNTVSWQSAFWALVPLALNSMTQPAGMVCGFPSSYGFFLRSSPIICLLDTFYLLIQLAVGIRTPRATIDLVKRIRFRDLKREEEGSLSSLQNNFPFRVTLFLLGALPQAVKLFAMKGIPETQALGSMYLASFILVEVLFFPTDMRPEIPPRDNLPIAIPLPNLPQALASTTIEITPSYESGTSPQTDGSYSQALGAHSVDKLIGEDRIALLRFGCVMLTSYTFFFWISFRSLSAERKIPSIEESDISFIAAISAGAIFIMAPFVFSMKNYRPLDLFYFDLFCYSIYRYAGDFSFSIFQTFLYFMPVLLFQTLQLTLQKQELQYWKYVVNFVEKWYIPIQQFVLGILWYKYVYSPEGTVKPRWTEQLG